MESVERREPRNDRQRRDCREDSSAGKSKGFVRVRSAKRDPPKDDARPYGRRKNEKEGDFHAFVERNVLRQSASPKCGNPGERDRKRKKEREDDRP